MGVFGYRQAPTVLLSGELLNTNFIRGCLCPDVGIEGCGKHRPHRDSIPGSSKLQQVVILNYAVSTHRVCIYIYIYIYMCVCVCVCVYKKITKIEIVLTQKDHTFQNDCLN
jgi:hypothetical protein